MCQAKAALSSSVARSAGSGIRPISSDRTNLPLGQTLVLEVTALPFAGGKGRVRSIYILLQAAFSKCVLFNVCSSGHDCSTAFVVPC